MKRSTTRAEPEPSAASVEFGCAYGHRPGAQTREALEPRQRRRSVRVATHPKDDSRSVNLNDSERFKIDRPRIAIIHVAKSRLGMADEAYREMLLLTAGVTSSKSLTEAGFRAVMRRFEQLGFTPAAMSGEPADDRRPGMASAAQCDYIRHMWSTWYGPSGGVALRKWLESRYHVSDLRFADVVTAQKAIEGLRAMLARGRRRAAGMCNTAKTLEEA